MRERSLVGEKEQLLKKRGEADGESGDFENRSSGRSLEKKRNRLADVVPEVCTFGFDESDELRGLCCRGSGDLSKFTGGALTHFRNAFDADAKVPGICGEFSLKRGGGRFGRTLFGFEEELHELRAEEISRSGANRRAFEEVAESESVFVDTKREDEGATCRRGGKSAEVEARYNGESPERADKKFVKVVAGDIFYNASAAFT